MLRFEQRQEKPISTRDFVLRMLRSAATAVLVTSIALVIGIAGYHWIGGLGWADAFLNASMILGGMGPVDPMQGTPAKIFAGCYALFSGLVFIALAGFFIAPIAHRVLHHFHYIDDRDS
jgi:hypothetical protein